MRANPYPEFSRPISVKEIAKGKASHILIASKQECEKLTKRFGVRKVEGLKAKLNFFDVSRRDEFKMQVSFNADVSQACVVTLEPFVTHINSGFECIFSKKRNPEKTKADFGVMDRDPPEYFEGETIDPGEIISEYLGLEIEPFPRLSGKLSKFEISSEKESDLPVDNPFNRLSKFVFSDE